jgi:hypothetical protein
MPKTIVTKEKVRLLNNRNVNGGFIKTSDDVNKTGNVPAVHIVYSDGSEYLIIIPMIIIDFRGTTITTTLEHYELSKLTGKWNSLDVLLVDATVFPNVISMITNENSLLNINTNKTTDLFNPDVWNHTTVNNVTTSTLKPEYVYYYKEIRYSATGLAVENMPVNDVYNRF